MRCNRRCWIVAGMVVAALACERITHEAYPIAEFNEKWECGRDGEQSRFACDWPAYRRRLIRDCGYLRWLVLRLEVGVGWPQRSPGVRFSLTWAHIEKEILEVGCIYV